tara:strand:+ start:136 stop:546 length:411 start_codon:yes stop_codon:yes gene_type:complete
MISTKTIRDFVFGNPSKVAAHLKTVLTALSPRQTDLPNLRKNPEACSLLHQVVPVLRDLGIETTEIPEIQEPIDDQDQLPDFGYDHSNSGSLLSLGQFLRPRSQTQQVKTKPKEEPPMTDLEKHNAGLWISGSFIK